MNRTQLQAFLCIVSLVVILHEIADMIRPGGMIALDIGVIAAMICIIVAALRPERTRARP